MIPGARVQAAIELLDQIVAAARDGGAAADTLVARYFATRRYAGSKDRRAVREHVYAAIRRAGERPESGRAAMLALVADEPELLAAFDGGPHAPAPVMPDEPVSTAGVAPGWLTDLLAASGLDRAEQAALVGRAPLDLRVNTLKSSVEAVQSAIGGDLVPGLPDALRLPSGTPIEREAVFRDGAVEVQDAGSQFVVRAAAAGPGQVVVDLCAGAGGKTLALAAAMAGEGTLIACDTDRGRLGQLSPRAVRAGAAIETRLLDPGREAEAMVGVTADVVLVDAPCSGTGTWRRNPEARWRLTPDRIERLAATQAHVLDVAAVLVRPGGALAYAVCSVLDREGPDQLAAFLARNRGWNGEPLGFGTPRGHGIRLTPARDATDGFFVARLRRTC